MMLKNFWSSAITASLSLENDPELQFLNLLLISKSISHRHKMMPCLDLYTEIFIISRVPAVILEKNI